LGSPPSYPTIDLNSGASSDRRGVENNKRRVTKEIKKSRRGKKVGYLGSAHEKGEKDFRDGRKKVRNAPKREQVEGPTDSRKVTR